jgi:hypothetical protein
VSTHLSRRLAEASYALYTISRVSLSITIHARENVLSVLFWRASLSFIMILDTRGESIFHSTFRDHPDTIDPSAGLVIDIYLPETQAAGRVLVAQDIVIRDQLEVVVMVFVRRACPFRARKNGFCLILSSISSTRLERVIQGFTILDWEIFMPFHISRVYSRLALASIRALHLSI